MVSKLALFPLRHVVFPGEVLPLHIFEDRYKQLIEDCEASGVTFGIPVYLDNIGNYGTEVALMEIVKEYASGAKDVRCRGLRIFRLREFHRQEKGKIYAGGLVEFLKNKDDGEELEREQLLDLIFELYIHLEVPPPKINPKNFNSYTLAHKLGLSIQQEFTLLKLTSEKARIAYLANHLSITIPIVQEINRAKYVIEMNGHFKHFDPLDFKEFRLTK